MGAQRVGLGYDIHRLEDGDALMLGGVAIPCGLRAIAHSDGDVLLHACCDALLGATAQGDLGSRFPDNDPTHADRASQEFLAEILADPALKPWRLVNLDANIIAQRPRLAKHRENIRNKLAGLLDCNANQVSLKIRSNEGLDAIGQGEAIAAQVIVLLEAV